MKIFVDTDSDIRLVRRLRRDITDRGREIVGVIKQYNKFVKPAFEQYIEPTMRLADIVVPRGAYTRICLYTYRFHLTLLLLQFTIQSCSTVAMFKVLSYIYIYSYRYS